MTSKAPGETSAASGWAWWAAGQRPERTAGAAGQALSVGAGAYTDATVSQGVLTAEPLCYGYRLDRYWLLAVFAAGWFLVWCLVSPIPGCGGWPASSITFDTGS